MRLPFRESGSVILDAGGDGTAAVPIGGVRTGQRWEVERMTVNVEGGDLGNPACLLTVYLAGDVIDQTTRGGADVSEIPNPVIVNGGEHLTFVWENGTVGARATAVVSGHLVIGEG